MIVGDRRYWERTDNDSIISKWRDYKIAFLKEGTLIHDNKLKTFIS